MYLHIKCNNSSIWYANARWNRINCTSNLFDFVASIWNWRFRGAMRCGVRNLSRVGFGMIYAPFATIFHFNYLRGLRGCIERLQEWRGSSSLSRLIQAHAKRFTLYSRKCGLFTLKAGNTKHIMGLQPNERYTKPLRDAIISEARRKLKFMENTSHAAVSEMRYE